MALVVWPNNPSAGDTGHLQWAIDGKDALVDHIAAGPGTPAGGGAYAIMRDGGSQIFTRATDPDDDGAVTLVDGDIWLPA